MTGTIAVVVLSFNRPRMLREALASITPIAEQVIVADDGSDFDVARLVAEQRRPWPLLGIVQNPPMEPSKRVRTATVGALVNRALLTVETDYCCYLCDDDLLTPEWLPAAVAYLDANPGGHMVRGDWFRFNDGESLDTAVPCQMQFDVPLTTGNFAHRMSCTTDCGCTWAEWTVSCHDYSFLDTYLRKHGSRDIAHAGVLAGYRREHPFNMLHFMGLNNDYKPAALEVFEAGMLEAAR